MGRMTYKIPSRRYRIEVRLPGTKKIEKEYFWSRSYRQAMAKFAHRRKNLLRGSRIAFSRWNSQNKEWDPLINGGKD